MLLPQLALISRYKAMVRTNWKLLIESEFGESYVIPTSLYRFAINSCKPSLRRSSVYYAAMHGHTNIIEAVLFLLEEMKEVFYLIMVILL